MNNLNFVIPSTIFRMYYAFILFIKEFTRSKPVLFDEISNYKLIKPLKPLNSFDVYSTGLYKKNNKKFVLKTWNGLLKDSAYFNLINEYKTLELLNVYLTKFNLGFKSPKAIEIIFDKNSVSIVMEYIQGINIKKEKINNKIIYLKKIEDGLSLLNIKMKKTDTSFLPIRTPFYFRLYIVIYGFIALVFNIDKTVGIVKVMKLAFLNVNLSSKYYFTHGDLSDENIIKNSNGLWLIDFANSVITMQGFDKGVMLTGAFGDGSICLVKSQINPLLYAFFVLQGLFPSGKFSNNKKYSLSCI